jgi:hypothetical protein
LVQVYEVPKNYVKQAFLDRQKNERKWLEELFKHYKPFETFVISTEELSTKLGTTMSKMQEASTRWADAKIVEKEIKYRSGGAGRETHWKILMAEHHALATFDDYQLKERNAVNKPPKPRNQESPRERIYNAVMEKGHFDSAFALQEYIKKPGENWSLHTITGHIANLAKHGRIDVEWSDQKGSKPGASGKGTKPINIRPAKTQVKNGTVAVEEKPVIEEIADKVGMTPDISEEPKEMPQETSQEALQQPTTASSAPEIPARPEPPVRDFVNRINGDWEKFPITMELVKRRNKYESLAKEFENDDPELAILILDRRATFTAQDKEMMALYDEIEKCREEGI